MPRARDTPVLQPDGWGEEARIGLLTPHNDLVPENEVRTLLPEGVSVHVARVPLGWRRGPEPPLIGLDAVRAFAQPPHLDEAAALLAANPLDAIAYAFTSSSYLLGPDGDAELARRLQTRSGDIPVVIPCPAAVLALQTLQASRVTLVHPPWFPAELGRLGKEYFRNAGFEVAGAAAAAGLPSDPLRVRPEQLYEWVSANVPAAADAVFIGGGGLRAIAAIEALEASLERPVLTANQVVSWHALRIAQVGHAVSGYGRIFAHGLPATAA